MISDNPFFGGSNDLALDLLEKEAMQIEADSKRRGSLKDASYAEYKEHTKYKDRFHALQEQVNIEREHYKTQLEELRNQVQTMSELLQKQNEELDMRRGFSAIDDSRARVDEYGEEE